MKINILRSIAFLSILVGVQINACGQQKYDYIVFYKPYTINTETNKYSSGPILFDYSAQYENLKNADVKKDLMIAISHKDYRFISISGNSYLWPGMEGGYKKKKDGTSVFYYMSDDNEKYIDRYKFKVIYGTSDAVNMNGPDLQGMAYDYAKKYNKLLLAMVKKLESTAKN